MSTLSASCIFSLPAPIVDFVHFIYLLL